MEPFFSEVLKIKRVDIVFLVESERGIFDDGILHSRLFQYHPFEDRLSFLCERNFEIELLTRIKFVFDLF